MEKIAEKFSKLIQFDFVVDIIINIVVSFILILLAGIIIRILNKIVKKYLKLAIKISERKKKTLETVFTSIIKYGIWFIIGCIILAKFGIDISSLIAFAGVGSIVIGLGAQSLVQDIITGTFILFEDQFGIGDIIRIDTFSGKVESIGLRSTRLRNLNGDLHIIPNGMIKTITNMSKEFNRASIEVGVSYDGDIDKILDVVKDEMKAIYNNKKVDGLLDIPNVLGIESFGDSSINIKILADTKVGENWNIEREIRRIIKNRFDKENINIPYPMRTVEIIQKDK